MHPAFKHGMRQLIRPTLVLQQPSAMAVAPSTGVVMHVFRAVTAGKQPPRELTKSVAQRLRRPVLETIARRVAVVAQVHVQEQTVL
jgi:hypothetical protein